MLTYTYNRFVVLVLQAWAGRKTLVHRAAGRFPAFFIQKKQGKRCDVPKEGFYRPQKPIDKPYKTWYTL